MIPVLYTDAEVIAVDKPAGIAVVPAGGESADACLRHLLERQIGEAVWVVHRLDRDTSGVVVFARTAEAHRRISQAFEHRLVVKTYVALTAGIPEPPGGTIDVPLHQARKGKSRPAAAGESGAAASTSYTVLGTWRQGSRRAAIVEARPQTGRHHQIRVHLRAVGAPILFDNLYGRATLTGEWKAGPCQRLALHACRLELRPSGNGPSIRIEAAIATDIAAQIAWFDAGWEITQARAAGENGLLLGLFDQRREEA